MQCGVENPNTQGGKTEASGVSISDINLVRSKGRKRFCLFSIFVLFSKSAREIYRNNRNFYREGQIPLISASEIAIS